MLKVIHNEGLIMCGSRLTFLSDACFWIV